jgi:hypothetical protein
MQRFINFACLLTLFVAGSFNVLAKSNGEATRALEILKQARVAIGGEEKIASVQSLTLKGKFRRVMQEREMAGEREFNFLLPDKFMKSDTLVVPGSSTSFTSYRALSGSESWAGGGSGNGGMMFISRDGSKPTKEQMEKIEREQAQRFRAEYARYVLALLLTQPSGYSLEFTYAGEAVADDGRADVIDATGPENFAARLFLDKETHLPLMLTYRAPKPRVFTTMMRSNDAGDKKKQEDALKEAREKAAQDMATAKPEEVEMQLRFTDYRKTGGLLLPHRITQGSDGEVNEEWEIKTYELNPQFKADKFQKK